MGSLDAETFFSVYQSIEDTNDARISIFFFFPYAAIFLHLPSFFYFVENATKLELNSNQSTNILLV
jgi:hypothetical protein